jgi:hypothetical protein
MQEFWLALKFEDLASSFDNPSVGSLMAVMIPAGIGNQNSIVVLLRL